MAASAAQRIAGALRRHGFRIAQRQQWNDLGDDGIRAVLACLAVPRYGRCQHRFPLSRAGNRARWTAHHQRLTARCLGNNLLARAPQTNAIAQRMPGEETEWISRSWSRRAAACAAFKQPKTGAARGDRGCHRHSHSARRPRLNTPSPGTIHVLSGEPLERVRRRNMEDMIAGAKPKRDNRQPWRISGCASAAAGRYRQAAVRARLGIARDDKPMLAGLGAARISGNSTRRSRWWFWPMTACSIPARPCHFDSRRALLRHRAGRVGPRAWHRRQRAGHHAFRYRARGCPYSGGSGHHDLRRDGISRRLISRRQTGGQVRAPAERRSSFAMSALLSDRGLRGRFGEYRD